MNVSLCASCGTYLKGTDDAFVLSYWDGANQSSKLIRQYCGTCAREDPELFILRIVPEQKEKHPSTDVTIVEGDPVIEAELKRFARDPKGSPRRKSSK